MIRLAWPILGRSYQRGLRGNPARTLGTAFARGVTAGALWQPGEYKTPACRCQLSRHFTNHPGCSPKPRCKALHLSPLIKRVAGCFWLKAAYLRVRSGVEHGPVFRLRQSDSWGFERLMGFRATHGVSDRPSRSARDFPAPDYDAHCSAPLARSGGQAG